MITVGKLFTILKTLPADQSVGVVIEDADDPGTYRYRLIYDVHYEVSKVDGDGELILCVSNKA